jgi:hypothetical protein
VAAGHSVVLRDLEGNPLAQGKTTDISERGVLALTSPPGNLRPGDEVLAELAVPALSARGSTSRTVIYRCRLIRLDPIAEMAGVALEFISRCP